MWGQVGIKKALRAYLSGRPVKVVDLSAETVLTLSEVLSKFEEGCFFFTETVAVENLEFKEAVEEMTADLSPVELADALADAIEEDLVEPDPDRRDPTATAALYGKGDGMSHAKEVTVERKRNRNNKTVADVEHEYQTRKIDDLGKLRTLRAAGWPVKKIAEEFRCSDQTVRNTMKREGIA